MIFWYLSHMHKVTYAQLSIGAIALLFCLSPNPLMFFVFESREGSGENVYSAYVTSSTVHVFPADGSTDFKAEAGRYHIYVSLACPWAHRALIVRELKGLEDVISISVVDWYLTDKGWSFTDQVI